MQLLNTHHLVRSPLDHLPSSLPVLLRLISILVPWWRGVCGIHLPWPLPTTLSTTEWLLYWATNVRKSGRSSGRREMRDWRTEWEHAAHCLISAHAAAVRLIADGIVEQKLTEHSEQLVVLLARLSHVLCLCLLLL